MAEKIVSVLKDLGDLKNNLRGAFESIKDEMDVHLDSINQNTNEIQGNYTHITDIEAKVDKLSDKIDEIQMQLNPNSILQNFDDISLSKREQEVFMSIYTEEDRISIVGLAKKLGLTLEMCELVLSRIKAKGIPLVKQLVNEEILVSLDYDFKDLQARKNILRIDTTVSQIIR
ncbi:MAG: hypothetical protein ABIB43_05220 [archaeon]